MICYSLNCTGLLLLLLSLFHYMRNISNYRINRLLLSGDYVCSDSENNLFLLAPIVTPPTLQNILIESIILPIEIIYMNENSLYYCFPIEASMTQCLGRMRGRLMLPIASNLQALMLDLTVIVMNASSDKTLKGELLACLNV
jgi:hypothetical protein